MTPKTKPVTPAAVRAKLSQLSQKTGRDFNALALEFALERLVVRLSGDAKLSKALVFKGGFVLLKAYGSDRLTIDVDTSLSKLSFEEAEKRVRAVIEKDWNDGLWMGAVESERMDHQTEYNGLRLTIRFSFGAPKVDAKRLGKLVLDIGLLGASTQSSQEALLQPLLGGEPLSWRVYPIELIIAEKLHALVSHGSVNSRFKDVYDLAFLLPKCKNVKSLQSSIQETFEIRQTPIPESFVGFWKTLDKESLRKSSTSVSMTFGKAPEFSELEKTLTKLLLKL